MANVVERRPITPKSNIFCSKNRDISIDTTYKNHYPQKLDMSAYAETLRAVEDGRQAAGLPATKVHIFPGMQRPVSKSSYGLAYNKELSKSQNIDRISREHIHMKPSCTHCKYEAILDSHHFRERSRGKKDVNLEEAAMLETLRGTHFTFGNDKPKRATVYKDFTSLASSPHKRTKMVSPPLCAEVMPGLPSAAPNPDGHRSSLQTDFTFFGTSMNEDIHHKQKHRYDTIKTLHGFDSVGASIQGKRDKLLSGSMIDYIHPLRMRSSDVKNAPVLRLSTDPPIYRQNNGNIWDLNPPISRKRNAYLDTENRQNFSWLTSKAGMGFKRFYKGCISDKVR